MTEVTEPARWQASSQLRAHEIRNRTVLGRAGKEPASTRKSTIDMNITTSAAFDREALHAREVKLRAHRLLTGGLGAVTAAPGISEDGAERFRTWQSRISVTAPEPLLNSNGLNSEGETGGLLTELRLVAATLPPMGMDATARAMTGIVDNPRMPYLVVRELLYAPRVSAPDVAGLQLAWQRLTAGASIEQAALASGVTARRLRELTGFWGLKTARSEERLDWGLAALESGWDAGRLMAEAGLSRDVAYKALREARAVLAELGQL